MAYCTQQEVEAHTGYSYSDFRQADSFMTSQQWATYITAVIAAATQMINRYCNRTSFEETSITEYHDGRGPTADRRVVPFTTARYSRFNMYREIDRTYLPREQPVTEVTSVHVDTTIGSTPTWIEMTERSALAYGDYQLITDGFVTRIRFHDNVPGHAQNNVRIVYKAGYATGDPVLNDIKYICLDLIANILAHKKREQEAVVASFDSGTQTIAQMIQMLHPEILPDDLKLRLNLYRRTVRGQAWH